MTNFRFSQRPKASGDVQEETRFRVGTLIYLIEFFYLRLTNLRILSSMKGEGVPFPKSACRASTL